MQKLPTVHVEDLRKVYVRRSHVRGRRGGKASPLVHGGSLKTMREARTRRDLVAGETAAGRTPAALLRGMVERPTVRTFAEWGESSRTSRIDIGDETRKNMTS